MLLLTISIKRLLRIIFKQLFEIHFPEILVFEFRGLCWAVFKFIFLIIFASISCFWGLRYFRYKFSTGIISLMFIVSLVLVRNKTGFKLQKIEKSILPFDAYKNLFFNINK